MDLLGHPPAARRKGAGVFRFALLRVIVLFGCGLLLQQWSGAFQSSTRGNPDEPAHIVTGLMVRDYLAHGLGGSPMEFARNYYLHYPKVALGHWPPMFYLEQAAWTLLFPATRRSLLGLMALLAALAAAGLYPMIRDEYGALPAWCAVVVLLTLPASAAASSAIMAEIPQSLMILGAMLALGKYLDSERWQDALAFGLWSSASLLTKGTGLILAPVPLLAVLLARRSGLLRRASFWAPAALIAAIAAPWYVLAPDALHQRVRMLGGPHLTKRLGAPPWVWAPQFGWVVSILALIGLAVLCVRAAGGTRLRGGWAVAAALVVSGTVFPFFFGVWEAQHQVEFAPAQMAMAVAGGSWLAAFAPIRRAPAGLRTIALLAAALALAAWNVSHVFHQSPSEYSPLAQSIVENQPGNIHALLISADSVGEGALISEIAQREKRPGRYVLRSSKLLADLTWMGAVVRDRFHTAAEVDAFLNTLPLDMVVVDDQARPGFQSATLLDDVLATGGATWVRWKNPLVGGRFRIYLRRGGSVVRPDELRERLAEVGGPPVRFQP